MLAILATPLADAPAGVDRAGLLPYGVSVAVWYAINVACLFLGAHVLARALEQTSPDPAVRSRPAGCRAWWALRLWPVLFCLPPLGSDLVRGQVNVMLLALVCGLMAGLLRGHPWRAGLCLAGAICLKVFPAFLLIYPLWRRDYRCLAGCVLGLFVGLAVIPTVVFGPARAWQRYHTFATVILAPGLGDQTDKSRLQELTAVTTDTQSFLAVIHNTLHRDPATRPEWVDPWVPRNVHWLLGAVFTGVTLLAAGRRRPRAEMDTALVLGALVLLMFLLSPGCHMHYFLLALPLIMAFMARRPVREGRPRLGLGLSLLLGINLVCNIVPRWPGMQVPRDLGLVTYATMLLWLTAIVVLIRRRGAGLPVVPVQPVEVRRMAA